MAARGRPRSFDREDALRQAMRVFWSKGFDNASLAELTEAMGINPPSLYAAFGSKEGLFKEAVELYVRTEGEGIWEQVPVASSARAAIEGMLRATAVAFTRRQRPRGCMIVLAAPQIEGANPAVCEELKRRRAENIEILERRLEQAVADGELSSSANCRAIATYYATVQHGMSIQARDGASRETLLTIADCAMAAWEAFAS